jgi:hypothetical protein
VGQEFLTLGSEKVRVTDAIGAIIRYVVQQAVARQGGRPPGELRLTHPQRWAQARLGQLREAAGVAGFPDPEFVAEPVAAAIYFARKGHVSDGERVAVYDLGGGTFDTAVLERAGETFEVVGAGGIEDLGGEDFDEKLYRYLSERISPELWARLDEVDARRRLQDFRREVRRAKERLSREPDATIRSPVPGHADLQVTVPEFEDLIRSDVERTVDVLQETIAQANSGKGVSAVYVAGGSSRIPLVSRILADRLGRTPSMFGDPKAVTALGALRAPTTKPTTATTSESDNGTATDEREGEQSATTDGRGPKPVGTPTPPALPSALDPYNEWIDVAQALPPDQREVLMHHRLRPGMSPWAVIVLSWLTLGLFGAIYLQLKHGELPVAKHDDPSPGKAVGFLFIPFYNLYWAFVVWLRLADRLNLQYRLRGERSPISRGLIIAALVCGLSSGLFFFVTLPLAGVMFSISAMQIQRTSNRLAESSL